MQQQELFSDRKVRQLAFAVSVVWLAFALLTWLQPCKADVMAAPGVAEMQHAKSHPISHDACCQIQAVSHVPCLANVTSATKLAEMATAVLLPGSFLLPSVRRAATTTRVNEFPPPLASPFLSSLRLRI